jgi:hypothetical protein
MRREGAQQGLDPQPNHKNQMDAGYRGGLFFEFIALRATSGRRQDWHRHGSAAGRDWTGPQLLVARKAINFTTQPSRSVHLIFHPSQAATADRWG